MPCQTTTRWTIQQAQEWANAHPWICGFNFLPSSAVNFLEMWQRESFDPVGIARELEWASQCGFNAARVNLHYLVWKFDRNGLVDRMRAFLKLAQSHGIATVFVPFDDCGFGGEEPVFGKQPNPVTGVHNSRALASPGRQALTDTTLWPDFEAYVKDIISTFKQDSRILFWDLYNEPGNRMVFLRDGYRQDSHDTNHISRDLMKQSFAWARAVGPVQPLTVAAWQTAPVGSNKTDFDNEIDQLALSLSDIISFHAYLSRDRVADCIKTLQSFNRPIFLTEWMARAVGSTIETQLELLHRESIGCFNWGLVQGRTQTHLAWPKPLLEQHGLIENTDIWFHDIFWPDGRPYRMDEVLLVKDLTSHAAQSKKAE